MSASLANTLDAGSLPLNQKLDIVFERAAKLLPADVGNELVAMISPGALATMAVAVGIWAGSHFFGVGEIADIVLLVVGYVAMGGVAVEAAKHIAVAIDRTVNGTRSRDFDVAADHMAKAISLVGVQLVLAILLKQKPEETFKSSFKGELPPYSKAFPKPLPRNGGIAYKPSTKFTSSKFLGEGGTTPTGDVRIGRAGNAFDAAEQLRLTLYHEKVHQFLTPKLYISREVLIYARQSAYRRSYILRYLEEALAETVAQMRVYGFRSEKLLDGMKFPIGQNYQIQLSSLGHEGKGLLLGPATVGEMVFNVYFGLGAEQ